MDMHADAKFYYVTMNFTVILWIFDINIHFYDRGEAMSSDGVSRLGLGLEIRFF